MDNKWSAYLNWVEARAQKYLEKRSQRKERRKQKEKKKGQVREWVEAILWAVLWVLLINQFLFQLYQIPSSSMEDTLKIGDRLFVNKMIYGPQIYPGGPKMLDDRDPQRHEVIIFENPAYVSRGPLFDILNRVVYMLTLSLVNLDRHEDGTPRAQLYVKRAAAVERDRAFLREGELYIQPEGFRQPVHDSTLQELSGYEYGTKRLLNEQDYRFFTLTARQHAYDYLGVPLSPEDVYEMRRVQSSPQLIDHYELSRVYHYELLTLRPDSQSLRNELYRHDNGFYVPDGYVFPIGDNRDNSIDSRYFGPVSNTSVLGEANLIFWPFSRFGVIR